MSLQRLKECIVLTAMYYEKSLPPEILRMYVEDLQDLPVDLVIAAYQQYRRNTRNVRFPLPAQIRQLVSPEPNESDKAEQALGLVMKAIRDSGWCSPEVARASVGETAWKVIQRLGGWHRICSDPDFNMGVFKAQFLKSMESELKFEGIASQHALLEQSQNEKALNEHQEKVLMLTEHIGKFGKAE